jgi:hypothetical protein
MHPSTFRKKLNPILFAPLVYVVLSCLVFCLLQNTTVYNATINKIGFTYERINNPDGSRKEVKKINHVPFQQITNKKLSHWDASIYYNLSKNLYPKTQPNLHAFFPLFPLLWKIFHIPLGGIIYFNLLLFLLGYFFFFLCIRNQFELGRAHISFSYMLVLGLPSMAVFAIPYAEATSFFMFAMALFFMIRKQIWPSLIFFILLAWCRPNTLMIILAALSALAFYLYKVKKISAIQPILFTAIAGLSIGLVLLFTYFYFTSGNFLIFFEAQKNWGTQLQIPKLPFTDHTSEVFLIDRILLFVITPIAILKLISMLFLKTPNPGIWLYIRFFALSYFILTCLTVLFFQGGSLHSLHRYTLASPLGIIFIIDLCTSASKKNIWQKGLIYSGVVVFCAIVIQVLDRQFIGGLINNHEDQRFTNLGALLLVSILSLIFWFPYKHSKINTIYYIFAAITLFIAMVWDSVLFNQFLSQGWLWA